MPVDNLKNDDRTDGHFTQAQFDKLSVDVHTMKGALAANTSITLETADSVADLKKTLAQIDIKALVEALQAVQAMKGGATMLGWLERPAKWLMAIVGAVGTVWAAWHHWDK